MKLIQFIFLATVIISASGVNIYFQECGPSESYEVNEVNLNLQCKNQPCWIPLKRTTPGTISFRSTDFIALNITTEIYVRVANNRKRIEVTPQSCPKNLCPIYQNQKKTYTVKMKPNFHTEPIKVDIFWEAFNHKRQNLFCVMFPVIIYNPETHKPSAYFKILPNNTVLLN